MVEWMSERAKRTKACMWQLWSHPTVHQFIQPTSPHPHSHSYTQQFMELRKTFKNFNWKCKQELNHLRNVLKLSLKGVDKSRWWARHVFGQSDHLIWVTVGLFIITFVIIVVVVIYLLTYLLTQPGEMNEKLNANILPCAHTSRRAGWQCHQPL